MDGTLDNEDYAFIKKDTHAKIERLEFDHSHLSHRNDEITKLLKSELGKIGNMGNLYKNGTIEQKRQIISSIFPENLILTESDIELIKSIQRFCLSSINKRTERK